MEYNLWVSNNKLLSTMSDGHANDNAFHYWIGQWYYSLTTKLLETSFLICQTIHKQYFCNKQDVSHSNISALMPITSLEWLWINSPVKNNIFTVNQNKFPVIFFR